MRSEDVRLLAAEGQAKAAGATVDEARESAALLEAKLGVGTLQSALDRQESWRQSREEHAQQPRERTQEAYVRKVGRRFAVYLAGGELLGRFDSREAAERLCS